jgi:hypothetical protein
MGMISRPMAVEGWLRVDLYSKYMERVSQNLRAGRFFEAIALAGTCLDVLLHHMVDALLTYRSSHLDSQQVKVIQSLQENLKTAGAIIGCLKRIQIVEASLVNALEDLNSRRNRITHPFGRGTLKPDAIVPGRGDTKKAALGCYRLLCRIIEMAGGESPRMRKAEVRRYIQERTRLRPR